MKNNIEKKNPLEQPTFLFESKNIILFRNK